MAPAAKVDPKELVAQGWMRRSVASDPRLSELAEMYGSVGFEVKLVPLLEECAAEGQVGSCTECFGADQDPDRFKVIYTRPRKALGEEIASADDELFKP